MKKLIIIFLSVLVASGCEEESNCFICSTKLYQDGVEQTAAGRSNVYCDMDVESAYYFERANNIRFDSDGTKYEIDVQCKPLLK